MGAQSGVTGTTSGAANPAVGNAAVGAYAAGTLLSAGATILSGLHNSKVANYNAKIADMQAQDAIFRGKQDEQQLALGVRKLIGTQRAAFAGQNVEVNSGSALETQLDTARQGALDQIRIRNNAAREAWGFRSQGEVYRAGGSNAITSSAVGAGSTLLTGAAMTYGLNESINGKGK